MDQQQIGVLPVNPPVLEGASVPPVVGVSPAQQDNNFVPSKEERVAINWFFWFGLIGSIVLVLFLIYFFYIRGRVGNSITISPQELSPKFSIDKIVIAKSGFFVLIMGNDFNAPSLAFYSSPLLPAGTYKDVVVSVDENNYKDLLGTYKPNTKLFAYLFEDTNKSGEFDNVNGVANSQGPDKPFKDLSGNAVFVEIPRP